MKRNLPHLNRIQRNNVEQQASPVSRLIPSLEQWRTQPRGAQWSEAVNPVNQHQFTFFSFVEKGPAREMPRVAVLIERDNENNHLSTRMLIDGGHKVMIAYSNPNLNPPALAPENTFWVIDLHEGNRWEDFWCKGVVDYHGHFGRLTAADTDEDGSLASGPTRTGKKSMPAAAALSVLPKAANHLRSQGTNTPLGTDVRWVTQLFDDIPKLLDRNFVDVYG